MRKTIAVLALLMVVMSIISAVEPDASGRYPDQTFQAYKSKLTGGIPESRFETLILYTPEQRTINSSTMITTDASTRNEETVLFTWSASGTTATPITIAFEFNPLSLKSGNTVLATIPYTAKITHNTTTVDGIPVAVNRVSSATSPQRCSFSDYKFNYSDTVKTAVGANGTLSKSVTASGDVTAGSQLVLRMQYDLSSATVTKDSSGNTVTSNGQAIPYPYDVTDLWSRSGECTILLKIRDDGTSLSGTAFSAGWYTTTVTVSVTADT